MSEERISFRTTNMRYPRSSRDTLAKTRPSDRELHIWVDSGGSKRVCTELFKAGYMDSARYMADVAYCRMTFTPSVNHGYSLWGPTCASMMRRYKWIMWAMSKPTLWFVEDSAFQMSQRETPHWRGMFVRYVVFIPACLMALGLEKSFVRLLRRARSKR